MIKNTKFLFGNNGIDSYADFIKQKLSPIRTGLESCKSNKL